MITLENVSFSYRRGAEALRGVSARIGEGVHLLLGENGAGKTTLLHVMAGMLYPSEGKCSIDGVDTSLRLPLTQQRVFLLGDEMVFPARTINEFRSIHSQFYPTFSQEMLESALSAFGMTGDEPLDRMSLGTRKKAHIAYALSLRVPVLLLDEPANGLDIDSRKILRRLMSECISPEQTVVVSTHSVVDFGPLYDGVLVLHRSGLILAMTTMAILSRLAFPVTPVRPDDALYVEQELGVYRSIVPNEDSDPMTDIDYALLYSALMSRQSDEILNRLNRDSR